MTSDRLFEGNCLVAAVVMVSSNIKPYKIVETSSEFPNSYSFKADSTSGLYTEC